MEKKIYWAVICICFVLIAYLLVFPPAKPANSVLTNIPTKSLEESICEKVTAQFGNCKRFLLFDTQSNIVFVESDKEIIPVLTNRSFTEYQKFIPMMDFQEFYEEKGDRGPFDWRAAKNVQKDLSIIYGFAEDEAKTIVINSEGNIQPNKFFVRDNLWAWYAIIPKDEIKLPVDVTVYNSNGQIIFGGTE